MSKYEVDDEDDIVADPDETLHDEDSDEPREDKTNDEILRAQGISQKFEELPLEIRARVIAIRYLSVPKDAQRSPVVKLPFKDVKGNNQYHKSVENTKFALKELGVEIRYDEFTNEYELTGVDLHFLLDDQALRLIRRVLEILNYRLSLNTCFEHLRTIGEDDKFNSAVERFARLEKEWDGEPRLDKLFTNYLKTPDDEYHDFWSRAPLIACVMRVRRATIDEPIAYKYVPVLEGGQDARKSAFLRALAGSARYFDEGLHLDSNSKEAIEQTQGKLIVEVPEMSKRRGDKVEKIKAFISKATDRARLAYDKMAIEVPRRFVIYGTTNDDMYLTDSTGNVRFIPIKCGADLDGPIDVDALKCEIDQIWAEAAHRERGLWESGRWTEIYPTPELSKLAAEKQRERLASNPIRDLLEVHLGDFETRDYAFITSEDVARLCGFDDDQRPNSLEYKQIADAMKFLGWHRSNRRIGGQSKKRGYEKGSHTGSLGPEHCLLVTVTSSQSSVAGEAQVVYADNIIEHSRLGISDAA